MFFYKIAGKEKEKMLADLKKQGSYFDLAIAIGILQASQDEKMPFYGDYVLIGELSLDGSVLPIKE